MLTFGSRPVPVPPSSPGSKRPEPQPSPRSAAAPSARTAPQKATSGGRPAAPTRAVAGRVATTVAAQSGGDIPVGVAISTNSADGSTVTALQHLAKAVNIAFQTDFGENYLESVYQAAIVRRGEVHIVHREYFGFGDTWFGQFGRLVRSLQLSLEGPDPASPEGQKRIAEKGPASIRGLFNLIGRKLDLVAEYEDRVPAYVEQMFDRLEGSGIILGWDRNDWEIWTTQVGLDIRIAPKVDAAAQAETG